MISVLPEAFDKVTQAVTKNKSFIPHHDSNQAPVESGAYFKRVAHDYNVQIMLKGLEGLQKDVNRGNAQAKELYYLFDKLPTCTTIKQALAMLSRAIAAHKTMVKENAGNQEVFDRNEMFYSALLLQCCVVFTNSARDQFLGILEEVNNSLVYWREQKNHPTKYFFHKSPLKWVVGKSQAEEISDNIKKLEKLEHDIRVVLGKMIKHIYVFNSLAGTDGCYTWIEQLFSILSCVGVYVDTVDHDTRFGKIAEKLRFKVSRVGEVKKSMLEHVASARRSGHFVRNWLAYTVIAAAVYQGHSFYTNKTIYSVDSPEGVLGITNAQWVNKTVMDALGSMGIVWKGVTDPVKGAWYTVFGGTSAFKTEDEKVFNEAVEGIRKIAPDILLKKEELARIIDSSGEEGVFTTAQKKLNDLLSEGKHTSFGWSYDQQKTIKDDVNAGELKSLEKAVEDLGWVQNTSAKGELKETLYLLKIGPFIDKLLPMVGDVSSLISLLANFLEVVIPRTQESLKQGDLALKLAALTPAGSLLWGGAKMYSWWAEKDYSAVRLALIEINSLFIEAKAPLSNHDYGKLVYLLQGLKTKAMRYLPVNNNVREEFLVDIAKLESQQFDVKTKRNIIKNMFNKYPFLSLNVKSA